VPAAPEIGYASCLKGELKFIVSFESEKKPDADRQIRVTGEITVYLKRVCVNREQIFDAGEAERIIEYPVDEFRLILIGDYNFLDKAEYY